MRAEEDVVRLDVPVDDTASRRLFERAGSIRGDSKGALRVDSPFPVNKLRDRFAVDELHREEEVALGVPVIEQVDRVRRTQQGRDVGLAFEALAEILVEREVRVEQLDGDPGLIATVGSFVDGTHPARPELADKTVVLQDRRYTGSEFGISHRGYSARFRCMVRDARKPDSCHP